MRYYLDTNILEFMLHSRETDLHEDIFAILSDYENTLLTSSVCVHEFIHLAQIGKLDRGKRKTNPDDILKWIESTGIEIVSVCRRHLQRYSVLPMRNGHRDPNDRMTQVGMTVKPRATQQLVEQYDFSKC